MILCDSQIVAAIKDERIQIQPKPDTSQIQPASLDVRLGSQFRTFTRFRPGGGGWLLDPLKDAIPSGTVVDVADGCGFQLRSGQFALATTYESIGLAADIVSRVEGCSSLGRLGLQIHVTAGFIDPGWPLAPITLELYNVSPIDLLLTPGMKIAQLSFHRMDRAADRPYGSANLSSHYVNQQGATPSRYGKVID
jgi:dCTP deaminase